MAVNQEDNVCPCDQQGIIGVCAVSAKVHSLLEDSSLMASLDMSSVLSRLDLSKTSADTRRPAYDNLYPHNWVGDQQNERRHREAFIKLTSWPAYSVGYQKNKFDYLLVSLMTVILAFNADFYTLLERDKLEKIQMNYIKVLNRYLRSRLPEETANSKFLEAMMLIAHTRNAWEIFSLQEK